MIESLQNSTIKKVMKLREKKYRDKYGLFVVEGRRFVDEAREWEIEKYLLSKSFVDKNDISFYKTKGEVLIIADDLMRRITDTVEPQGVLAVCIQKKYSTLNIFDNSKPFIIACENISDPGNLGTIIRTAFAAKVDGIVLSKGCVDLYSPKVIRATAGMIFRIPIITDVNMLDFFEMCKQKNITLYGAHLNGEKCYYETDFNIPSVCIIGNEAFGLSPEAVKKVDFLIKIPMANGAESLNAAVAGGIFIYEALRQRLIDKC